MEGFVLLRACLSCMSCPDFLLVTYASSFGRRITPIAFRVPWYLPVTGVFRDQRLGLGFSCHANAMRWCYSSLHRVRVHFA